MAEATTPFIQLSLLHSFYLWQARLQPAQQPMKRVSLRDKEPPSRLCSISVASRTENSLEKPARAHMRLGSILRCHISLAGGRRLLTQ